MRINRKLVIAAIAVLFLSGCGGAGGFGNKQLGGMLLGGAGGGFLGSQFGKGNGKLAATAIGALLGVGIGGSIGQSLDRIDQLHAQQAAQTAINTAPSNQTVVWQNPNTGNYGSTTPLRTYQTQSGQYCREYQQEVTVGGRTQRAYGTACRQSDGSWQIRG